MDCNCWSSSGIQAIDRCSRYYSLQKGDDGAVSISILAVGSRTSRWRLLWRKLMREKKKIFDCTSPVQLPYDPYTYSQNFEDRGSMRFDDLDSISRSFSARFAVPARVFAKDELVTPCLHRQESAEKKEAPRAAMPKNLQKSLQDYLSKIKKPSPQIQLPSKTLSSSKSWILSGCKHPKTLSFAIDHKEGEAHNNNDAATLADVDRFLFENFRSLFLRDDDCNGKKGEDEPERQKRERFTGPPPDICNPRFFTARSLMEEAPARITASSEEFGSSCSASTSSTVNDAASNSNKHGKSDVSLPNDCIAVLTNSLSPLKDFRRSMQEIVEEHLQNEGNVDWDFMRELLFCYLDLNEKKSHKYILNAFVDLVVIVRKRSAGGPVRSRNIRVLKLSEKVKRR